MQRVVTLGTLIGIVCLAGPVWGDRLILENGNVLEGSVEFHGDTYSLRNAKGISTTIAASEVARVEQAPTPEVEFLEKARGLEPEDVGGLVSLAAWCDKRRLKQEALEIRERILEQNPDHRPTRRALAHILHEGKWMTRAEYMTGLGLIAQNGSWVTPETAEQREDLAEAKLLRPKVERAVRKAVSQEASEVSAALAKFPQGAVIPVLERKVILGGPAVRQFSANELGRRKAKHAEAVLARAAVADTERKVRAGALEALKGLGPLDQAPRHFIRSLAHPNPFRRVHAAQALAAFPVAAGVPALIKTLYMNTSGFGTVSMSVQTQRAYIRGYTLSAGGTGLVVAEVADPEVATFQEGVFLETTIISWERTVLVSVLQRMTGQSFGPKPGAWQDWWREEGEGFQLPD